jgi:predicted Zn-dependent protease
VKPGSNGGTFAIVQISTKGEDPADGARADGLHKRLLERLEPAEINGLPAVVLRTEERGSAYDVTWIAHRGSVYRISGVARTSDLASSGHTVREVAATFRDLQSADLERIREQRLRTAAARRDETIAALYERTGSVWKPREGELYNDITPDASLPAGQLQKFAREEAWSGAP